MAINKVQFGENTLMDITDTTALASDVVKGKYFYTANGIKTLGTKIMKFDTGTFEVNADSSEYTISGIVDSNGNSFTPNVIIFIMVDEDTPTTHNLGSNKMFAFFKTNSFSARICTYSNTANTIRTNNSTGGITYGNGTVKYSTSSSTYYIAKGTYRWYALREE